MNINTEIPSNTPTIILINDFCESIFNIYKLRLLLRENSVISNYDINILSTALKYNGVKDHLLK